MAQTIGSLEGYVRKIRYVRPNEDEVLLYRGHSNRNKYKLEPYVLREQRYRSAEHSILRELVASHPAEFANDHTTLEQLARVQHYQLPTRLLDLSWNPLEETQPVIWHPYWRVLLLFTMLSMRGRRA